MKHDEEYLQTLRHDMPDEPCFTGIEVQEECRSYHEHMDAQKESKAAGAVWTFLDKVGYSGDLEADYINFHVTGKELRQLMNAIEETSIND